MINTALGQLHNNGTIEYFELSRADQMRLMFFASRLSDLVKTFSPDEYRRKLWICRYLEAEYESLHGSN